MAIRIFKAKQKMPFGIKTGDIFIYDDVIKYVFIYEGKEDDVWSLTSFKGLQTFTKFNILNELEFFTELKPLKYKPGSNVYLKKQLTAYSTGFPTKKCQLPAYTELKVVSSKKGVKSEVITIQFNGLRYEIDEKLIITDLETYWFINSHGEVCKDFVGKHEYSDIFRKKSGNYFTTIDEAREKLKEILSK